MSEQGSKSVIYTEQDPVPVRRPSVRRKLREKKKKLQKASQVVCLHCFEIYRPTEIEEWVDYDPNTNSGLTPLCPHCSVDCVEIKTEELTWEKMIDKHNKLFFPLKK